MVPDSVAKNALRGEPCSFADMRLHVGMRMQIQLAAKGASHSTTLVGWVEGAYIIVRSPMANGVSVPVADAEAAVIRVFSGIHIYSFATRIQRNFRDPLFYMHLEFPSEVRALAFRSAPRVRVQVAAKAGPEGSAVDCAITDLSTTGAMACAPEALGKPGDAVQIAFELANGGGASHAIRLTGRIRNRREGAAGAAGCFGIQFDTPDEEAHLRLQNFVYERMLESRAEVV